MLTLFKARSVITMNPSMPRASAVLVRDGIILEVGEVENMQPWLQGQQYQVDEQFAGQIICPGFIDPHLHPSMAAVLLPMEFITAMRWKLPWGEIEPVPDAGTFDQRMQELHASKPADEPLFIWGYHQLWHGEMNKARINAVSEQRPIVVWHRSFHELYMNDATMRMAGIDPEQIKPGMQIDIDNGHFFEMGLGFAINRLNPWILAPERYAQGLQRLKQVVHHGGHTSIGDLATGLFNFDTEAKALAEQLEGDDVPFRTRLVVHGTRLTQGGRRPEEGPELAAALVARNSHRLHFGKHIKLFCNGAFFSQLAQLQVNSWKHGVWVVWPRLLHGFLLLPHKVRSAVGLLGSGGEILDAVYQRLRTTSCCRFRGLLPNVQRVRRHLGRRHPRTWPPLHRSVAASQRAVRHALGDVQDCTMNDRT